MSVELAYHGYPGQGPDQLSRRGWFRQCEARVAHGQSIGARRKRTRRHILILRVWSIL
uniref:Uncharacterized protein n=1 Tax=Arundo donax TaxID=35708 RepID=A0A0A9FQ31_ARUDO